MVAETKASVKSRFETNDTPTQTDFGTLIDSYTDSSDILTAIGTAAQSGKIGVIEIKASAEVTALPVADGGREFIAASSDSTRPGFQIALASTQGSAQTAFGLDGASAIVGLGDLKPFLRPTSNIVLIPAQSWSRDVDLGPTAVLVRPNNSSGRPCFEAYKFRNPGPTAIHFGIIHPNSVPEGENVWTMRLEYYASVSTNNQWFLAVSDGDTVPSSYALTYNTVSAFSATTLGRAVVSANVTASSNKGAAVQFRITHTSGDGNTPYAAPVFLRSWIIFPTSAANED